MKSILFVLLISSLVCAQLPDSVWSRAFGVNYAHWKCVGMVQTDDGFAVAGNEEQGERESDFLYLQLDLNGDSIRAWNFDGQQRDVCESIAVSRAGNLLFCGTSFFDLPNTTVARLFEVSPETNIIWSNAYQVQPPLHANAICVTHWGELILAGAEEILDSEAAGFVSRLSDSGAFHQTISITANGRYFDVCSIVDNEDSSYCVSGYTNWASNGSDDFWFRKYNLAGPAGIGGTYGGPARDRCKKIIATSDGGYLLAGTSLSYGQGDQDILLIKINANGDSLWSQTFGGAYFDDFGSVVETSFGSFMVVGTHEDENDGNFDMLIGSCDANGEHRQQSFIGGTEEDVGIDVVPLDSGVVMFAGHTRSMGGDWRKLWLMRTEYRPQVTVDRGSITFGAALIGDSVMRTLNIYNAGGVELIISALNFPTGYHANVELPLVLAPTVEFPLDIVFAPQAVGAHVGTLTISSNATPTQVRLVGSGQATAADEPQISLPERAEITAIYPNPFNAECEITFSLPQTTNVSLHIFDATGRTVKTLTDQEFTAGYHSLKVSGRDLATGLYFVRFNTPTQTDISKLILLR